MHLLQRQAEEFGMDPSDLATMSQSELAMRMGNDQAMMFGWNKRKSRGKVRMQITIIVLRYSSHLSFLSRKD